MLYVVILWDCDIFWDIVPSKSHTVATLLHGTGHTICNIDIGYKKQWAEWISWENSVMAAT